MRRLLAFIEGLPDDSATFRAINHGWTLAAELAATSIETTDLWGRIVAITLGQPPDKLPKPREIKHPGREHAPPARRGAMSDPAAVHSFFKRR